MGIADSGDETASADETSRSGAIYSYTCPICDEQEVGGACRESPIDRGLKALGTHIRAFDGDGHGPRHENPPDWSRSDLETHVHVVDP